MLQSFLFFIFVPCAKLATHPIKKKNQSKNGMQMYSFINMYLEGLARTSFRIFLACAKI